jgi:hypothetical protein
VVRENIASFFNISTDQLTKALLVRYTKACEEMTNISVGSYAQDIHTKLINTLSSAKRCFSYGEVVACIEVCALHGEMLTNFLCIVHEEQLKTISTIEKLTGKAKSSVQECLREDNFYDAFSGYNFALHDDNIIPVGCHAHARRPFAELVKSNKNSGLSSDALKFYRKLYAVEKEARDNKLSAEARYQFRLEKSVPIL